MFQITHNNSSGITTVKHEGYAVFASINLSLGASLQELILDGKEVISNLSPQPYSETYASAILFPFANRVEDGEYRFKGETYQLEVNHVKENNAIHGLVYDKSFSMVSKYADETRADLILEYHHDKMHKGFPFPFRIQVHYSFFKSRLDLKIYVENEGDMAFPFTLGWHPYFYTERLKESSVEFESRLKMELDHRNIGIGLKNIEPQQRINLKDKVLDDCWKLEGNTAVFKTPQYHLKLSSSERNGFLQIYTPAHTNALAIEPTTGVSNSLNTEIGLKILKPKDQFEITWTLQTVSN